MDLMLTPINKLFQLEIIFSKKYQKTTIPNLYLLDFEILQILYQIYTNVEYVKPYFTGVSDFVPIMRTFIEKLKL